MGASAKYGLDLYREIKEMKQKNERGLTKYRFGQYEEKKQIWADKIMEFEQSMDLASIKGTVAEKRWGLDKVWIWYQ